jgi:hypothetical protein
MPIVITDNEATAARRRVPLLIFADTAGVAWAGSVTGVKAQISVNGGSETASTADLTRVAGALHYVELTQAECNRTAGDRLGIRVASASGRLESLALVDITADDVFVAAPTDASIAAAVWSAVTRTLTSAGAGGATAAEVWAFATRTLTSGGGGGTAPTASENAAAVWANLTRTLTSAPAPTAAENASATAAAVWANGTRTLTSFGTLVADTATAVWNAVTRTITTAIPTAAENATAVRNALLADFDALPTAAEVATATVAAQRAYTNQSAWGVTTTPVGGSAIVATETQAGVTVGTRTFYYNNTGKLVGFTAVS